MSAFETYGKRVLAEINCLSPMEAFFTTPGFTLQNSS